jgi:Lipopolysaccharide kinase (Kdo/WaaP) family
VIFIAEPYRESFRQIGFAAQTIFSDAAVKPWRVLEDRQNCTWDIPISGRNVRLHVKRFPRMRGKSPAELEAEGYQLLREHGIPSVDVVAWGTMEDGRSFIATEDLAGFSPADKLLEGGLPFDRVLAPTADLASRLHGEGLHHRDLYLCHFMVRFFHSGAAEIRLIDAARVRALPGALTRRRWIVKDLAQFWYSTLAMNVSDLQRNEWLRRYCGDGEMGDMESLRKSVVRKSAAIGKHDEKLRRREPLRNISIPKS